MKISRWIRYIYLKTLRMKENPQKLARGLALGIFLNFLPTFGTGVFVALIVARFVRASAFLACSAALATKWCIPLLYALNLKVGQILLGMPTETMTTIWAKIASLDLSGILALGKPFIVGSLLNSIIGSGVMYLVFLLILPVMKRNPLKN